MPIEKMRMPLRTSAAAAAVFERAAAEKDENEMHGFENGDGQMRDKGVMRLDSTAAAIGSDEVCSRIDPEHPLLCAKCAASWPAAFCEASSKLEEAIRNISLCRCYDTISTG